MADDKTEDATAHHLSEARKKGQLARSQEIVAAAGLLAAIWVSQFTGQQVLLGGVGLIRWATDRMARPAEAFDNLATIGTLASPLAVGVFGAALTVAAATVGISVLQTGLNFTWFPLMPNFGRLNPLEGFKRLFSGRLVMDLAKTTLKAALAISVGAMALRQEAYGLETLLDIRTTDGAGLFVAMASRVAWKTATVVALVSAVDVAYQRFNFKKSMRMSRTDIKDEYKNQEGNPQMRARRARARRALAKKMRMDGVRNARVVVTNPTHYAVALVYQGEDNEVPRVVAKGADGRAHRIVAVARRHGVRVLESPPLARSLFAMVEVGQVVPPAMYMAVAEVLLLVQRLDEQFSSMPPLEPYPPEAHS